MFIVSGWEVYRDHTGKSVSRVTSVIVSFHGLTLVDVIIPVSLEPRRVEKDTRVRTEGAEVLAVFRLHDERAPSATIFGGLIFQSLADLLKTIRFHT